MIGTVLRCRTSRHPRRPRPGAKRVRHPDRRRADSDRPVRRPVPPAQPPDHHHDGPRLATRRRCPRADLPRRSHRAPGGRDPRGPGPGLAQPDRRSPARRSDRHRVGRRPPVVPLRDEQRVTAAVVGGVATVDFHTDPIQVVGPDQTLAIAQVVYTVTQQPGVTGVSFDIAGEGHRGAHRDRRPGVPAGRPGRLRPPGAPDLSRPGAQVVARAIQGMRGALLHRCSRS